MHDLYFSTKVILFLFIVRKAKSWLQYSLKYKDQTMARDEHSWLCDVHVQVYLLFLFLGWHIDQHLTYLLAFDGDVHFHFMSVLSGKRMRDMFWDLGFSPQLWLINLNQKNQNQKKSKQSCHCPHICQSHWLRVMCTKTSLCLNGTWGAY